MVIPSGKNSAETNSQSLRRSSTPGNGSIHDSLRDSIHSSDGSLQLSDDEVDNSAVATTRLNTWLNGGSNETPLQLGTGTITSTTPVNPFVASNDLPSPFAVQATYTRYTAPPLAIPEISMEPSNTSDRPRMPPSPPISVNAPSNIFQNLAPSPPDEIKSSSFNSVFIESVNDGKKLDDTKKETIHGESFRFSNLNASSANSAADRVTTDAVPPKPHHHHQRSVSWGEKQESTIPPKAPKLSPKLSPVPSRHHRGPSEFSLFSVLTQSDSEGSPRNARSDGSRVNVEELLRMNPLETEAETLIIKVIEAQESNARKRANTGSSAILENVPDDATHIFMPQIDTVSSKSTTGTVKNNRLTFDFDNQQGSEPSNLPHNNIVDFGPTTAPTVTSNIASSPPLGSAPIQSNQRPPRPNLTRNATVEHKLANLTEALAGYHNKTGESTFANTAQRTEIEEAHNADVSAGEKLAKNASLIYRGRQKTDGKKTDKVPEDKYHEGDHDAPKSSHWPKIRAVTSVTKPKVNDTTNQFSAPIPSTSNHQIPISPGSVEERKKTDVVSEDVEQAHPEDAMECGAAASHIDDSRMKLNESGSSNGNGKKNNSWRVFHKVPIINSKAARDFRSFAGQRRSDLYDYLRFMVVVVFPGLAAAFILFHLAGT
jgi:hypothetical protein